MLVAELIQNAEASIRGAFSSPTEIFATVSGLIAGALIVVSSFVRTMIPLRWLAVASNLGFVGAELARRVALDHDLPAAHQTSITTGSTIGRRRVRS